VIGLIRHLLRARALRKHVATEIAKRRGEIVEHAGLRVDLGQLAASLTAIHRDADAQALLDAPAGHLARAVRRLAIVALHEQAAPEAQVHVAGLLELACEACGRRYPGNELRMHCRTNGFRTEHEGRCPHGHPLPSLAAEVVVR